MATNTDTSEAQARAQLQHITEMVGALQHALDAEDHSVDSADAIYDAIDDAVHAIETSSLSVEVRSYWTLLMGPSYALAPEEYRIVLCTGGPAVQIVGDLDIDREPSTARLQHQDWSTPWTDYRLTAEEEATLLVYARTFYFA